MQPGNLNDGHLGDTRFIDRLRRLDPAAWQRLAREDRPLFVSWCRAFGVPEANIDDVVQDALAAALEGIHSFRSEDPGGFPAWLKGIVQHKATDDLRCRARHHPAGNPVQPGLVMPQLAADEDRRSLAALVSRALAAVSPDFSERTCRAFWETVVESRPAPEVAAELGMSPAAVRLAKARVLERLTSELVFAMRSSDY